MPVRSAGLLLYRRAGAGDLEIWIAHMGGPFWAHKDAHAWSLPKGEYSDSEDPLEAARREFTEEMGSPPPDDAEYRLLGSFRQSSGKVITVFSAETDFRPARIVSNTFALEWPKGSGTVRDYPEIDDAGWFSEPEARNKLVRGQLPMLDRLLAVLQAGPRED